MKTIYLHVLDKGWVSFQYTNISELEEEFAQRGIEVGNGCELGYGCKLGDYCKVPKSLFISASRHSVSYWGYDAIQIGCKKHTISEWQKHFREIGKAEGYSEEQINEYGSYIDLIAKLHGRWNIKQK